MRIVELPEPTTLHAYLHSTEMWDLGTVKSRDDDTAVDISDSAATLKCLLKEHPQDADDDAIAELSLEGTDAGVLTATLTETEAEKLEQGTYYGSVAITFEPDHTVADYQSATMTAGDIELVMHEQATRDTA